MEIRNYTDVELAAIEPIEIGPKHYRNPFAPDGTWPEDEPRAALARRWGNLHWNSGEDAEGLPSDPLDALGALLAEDSVGWHRAEGPHGCAYFPHTASDVAAWEERALAMTAAQRPVEVEEKPVVNFADYIRLNRGD